MGVLAAVGHALGLAGSMTWEILWALILGFALSAVIQAVVPAKRSPGTWATATRERWRWLPAWAPHSDTQPAQQSLQAQISDHQNRIAMPAMGVAPAPTLRSRD